MLIVASIRASGVALALTCAFFIAGCGGGGGGDGGSPASGNTAQATISASNVATLGTDVATSVVLGLTGRIGPSVDQVTASPLRVKQDACQFSLTGVVTLDNLIRNAGTGSVTAGSALYSNFDHCTSWTVNGTGSVTGVMPITTGIQELVLTFSDLVFSRTSPAQTYRFSGTADLDYTIVGPTVTYVLILNGTVRNASSALVATLQNFQISSSISAGTETIVVTGRLIDATHGYVDLSTLGTLTFLFPGTSIWTGSFTMTGANRSATVTFTNGVQSEVLN